jgi:hypothetical protein
VKAVNENLELEGNNEVENLPEETSDQSDNATSDLDDKANNDSNDAAEVKRNLEEDRDINRSADLENEGNGERDKLQKCQKKE